MKTYLILLVLLIFEFKFSSGHSLAKLELRNSSDAIYSVTEDKSGKTITFVNPKPEKPTLREIVYYRVIEKAYDINEKKKKESDESDVDFDETRRPQTNGHGYQFFENYPNIEFEERIVETTSTPDEESEEVVYYVDESEETTQEETQSNVPKQFVRIKETKDIQNIPAKTTIYEAPTENGPSIDEIESTVDNQDATIIEGDAEDSDLDTVNIRPAYIEIERVYTGPEPIAGVGTIPTDAEEKTTLDADVQPEVAANEKPTVSNEIKAINTKITTVNTEAVTVLDNQAQAVTSIEDEEGSLEVEVKTEVEITTENQMTDDTTINHDEEMERKAKIARNQLFNTQKLRYMGRRNDRSVTDSTTKVRRKRSGEIQYQDIPEAPKLSELNYNILPADIRSILSGEKPEAKELPKTETFNTEENKEINKLRDRMEEVINDVFGQLNLDQEIKPNQEKVKRDEEKVKPVQRKMYLEQQEIKPKAKTFGINITEDHGYTWNEITGTGQHYSIGELESFDVMKYKEGITEKPEDNKNEIETYKPAFEFNIPPDQKINEIDSTKVEVPKPFDSTIDDIFVNIIKQKTTTTTPKEVVESRDEADGPNVFERYEVDGIDNDKPGMGKSLFDLLEEVFGNNDNDGDEDNGKDDDLYDDKNDDDDGDDDDDGKEDDVYDDKNDDDDIKASNEEESNEIKQESDSKMNSLSEIMNNEEFWKWLSSWTAAYMERLSEHIQILIYKEVEKQMNSYQKSLKTDDNISNDINKSEIDKDNEKTDEISTTNGSDSNEDDSLDIAIELLKRRKDKEEKNKNDKKDREDKHKEELITSPINNSSEHTPVKLEAQNIYGNAIGSDKVTNIFIFYPNDEAKKTMENIKPISDANKENVYILPSKDFDIDERVDKSSSNNKDKIEGQKEPVVVEETKENSDKLSEMKEESTDDDIDKEKPESITHEDKETQTTEKPLVKPNSTEEIINSADASKDKPVKDTADKEAESHKDEDTPTTEKQNENSTEAIVAPVELVSNVTDIDNKPVNKDKETSISTVEEKDKETKPTVTEKETISKVEEKDKETNVTKDIKETPTQDSTESGKEIAQNTEQSIDVTITDNSNKTETEDKTTDKVDEKDKDGNTTDGSENKNEDSQKNEITAVSEESEKVTKKADEISTEKTKKAEKSEEPSATR